MPDLPQHWRNDERVRFFARHLTPVSLSLRRGSEERRALFTAFMLSVNDQWFLMTAGHCITAVQQAREQGFKIAQCNLLDSMGPNPRFEGPVPFNWDDANPISDRKHPDHDYGILTSHPLLRRVLEENGVIAFTEAFWDHGIEEFETYHLIGIPEQWLIPTGRGRMNITTMIARLERTCQGDFPDTDAPMFYGRLRQDPLTDLCGMSGGPILGFKTAENGSQHYFLVAMQSSKLGGDRDISGMLMAPLARLIAHLDQEP
jgi:hypothetical protein